MKVILSHDVDHLYWSEHVIKDLFIPKLIYRTGRQCLARKINLKTAIQRLAFWRDARLNRIHELTTYLESRNLYSHFFFGMDNALGLSYHYKSAQPFIEALKEKGFGVGVHGISYNQAELMNREYNRFREVSGIENFGIRTHYLRMEERTPIFMNKLGYRFNSSLYGIRSPFKWPNTNLWEFPVCVMESYAINRKTQDLGSAKSYTLNLLNEAYQKELPYFIINFHDPHFDKAFSVYQMWFIWLIEFLQSENFEFTSFETAIHELES